MVPFEGMDWRADARRIAEVARDLMPWSAYFALAFALAFSGPGWIDPGTAVFVAAFASATLTNVLLLSRPDWLAEAWRERILRFAAGAPLLVAGSAVNAVTDACDASILVAVAGTLLVVGGASVLARRLEPRLRSAVADRLAVRAAGSTAR